MPSRSSAPSTVAAAAAASSRLRLSRRAWAGTTALAAATLAFPLLKAHPRLEKTRVSIAVGGKAALCYLPLTVSQQLGYFKSEGLDIEITDLAGDARALQAVLGGSADVCSAPFEHTIRLQAKNQVYQAFVLQVRAPQIAFGVSARTMPTYKTLQDLKGKAIGAAEPGSSSNMMASLVLLRGGLQASDVRFVDVGTATAALTALRSGQIDAISNTDPVMTTLEQKGEVKIISDSRTLKGAAEVFGGVMPAACLFAAQNFVQKNPNTCQALANAMVRGLKWLQTAGPGDMVKTVPDSYLLGDSGLYLASFNKLRESISPDGIMPDDAARTALSALARFDPTIRADKIDLSKTFTTEFCRRAKQRFQA